MNKYVLRRIGVASNASATRPSLSDCIELVLGQVHALASDVMVAIKALVAKPDGEPANDAVIPEVGLAAAELLTESQAVSATLAAELRRLVYQSGSQDFTQVRPARFEDIHVFDIREIEVHIELALSRQEVMRAVDDVLPLFDALVSALLGWTSVQSLLNPLKPEAFVRALHETLNAWVPDEAVRMVLLRPAAVAMGIGLRQLYREACDWLRSQGVEPVEQLQGRGTDGAIGRSRQAQTEVERTMVTLDKLRRLLAGEALSALDSAGLRDFTHTVPGSLVALQDLKLVEPMMKRLAERSARPFSQGPLDGLRDTSAAAPERIQAQNQQIGRDLGEEVARMMLDQVTQDERLLAPVRAQLRLLEPVLLRLAKADSRFFIDRAHSARQFLDRVVQRSLAYRRDDEDGITGFVACLAQAVSAVSEGPDDAHAWARVLGDLEQDLTAFEEMRRRQREEVQRARQHADQRMVLAQRFSDAMMDRFKNSGLPELVASFLRGPWSQVLAEIHLDSEVASPDPRGYLALVDDLVWSVQLPLIRRDYARLVRLIPRLLSRINEGLVLIRYPQEPISIFLDELSALHDKVLEDHRRAAAAARDAPPSISGPDSEALSDPRPAPPPTDTRDADTPERRARARLHSVIAPELTSTRDLVVGAWVDLHLGGVWLRAQLTWIGRNHNLFMFVSGAGLAHAMSRRTMDRLVAQDRMRLGRVAAPLDLVLDTTHGILAASDSENAPAALSLKPRE